MFRHIFYYKMSGNTIARREPNEDSKLIVPIVNHLKKRLTHIIDGSMPVLRPTGSFNQITSPGKLLS